MSKKIKSRVAAFLLSLQVFFSMVAPVQPFLNVVQAMAVGPASFALTEGALRAHGLSDGEYQYFFVDQTGVLQASVGTVADGQLDLTWLSQSGTDLIDLQPQRVVLKTATATYQLALVEGQVEVVASAAADGLELTAGDRDFLFDIWQIAAADRSAVTAAPVVLGQTYRFPLQTEVQVTFTRLPDSPSALTIQEIELSPEQQAMLGALSPLAYDITTDMNNGEFAFDLRLPLTEATDQELVVKYADSVEELAAAQVSDNEIEVATEAVVIKELEHMTVFVVTGAPVPVGAACQDAGASIGGTCFADLQSAINASVNGDTIELQTNLTTNSQITIANKTIVINGNGHTVTPTFTKTSNSNNAVFGINGVAATVTLNDLIIDGATGTDLHGINVYVSNAVLNNVDIRNNQNTAININGSHVVVHNLSTSGNATKAIFGTFYSFNVIELAKGSGVSREPMLTITGQSQHSEIQDITNRRHINTKAGAVVDVNSQYSKSGSNYMLKSAPAAPANLVAIVTDNNVVASWNAVGYAHSYDYEITGVTTRTGNTTSLTATETSLPNGDYEITVRSVAQSGLTGNWTNPVAFSINFNPHPDPENKYQMSVGGHLYRDFQMNDCFGKTSCENRAERLGAGWTMNLYEEAIDGEWILHSTTTSIADGSFKFPAVKEAGRYHLCQVTNAGWTQQVQNWSGTPYHIPTMNQSGNMTEGPYCRTIVFDDTKSYSNASYFGNVDMTKPITEVVSPASGAYYNGGVISLNLKSADFQSGIAKVVANIHQVGKSPTHLKTCVNSTLNPVQNEHEFVCQIDTALLADGAYFVKANALDLAGNMSNTISWDFIVDSTKPISELISPLSGTVWNTPITISGSSNDNVSVKRVMIDYSLAAQNDWQPITVIENTNSDLPFAWNYVWTPSVEGAYDLRVRAEDEAGNMEGTAYAHDVAYDVTAPVITITNPTNGSIHNGTVQLRASIQDPNLRHYWLNIKRDGVQIVNQTVLSDSFEDKLLRTLVDDGEYVVTLAARDKAGGGASTGNRSADVVMTFRVDTTAPAAPTWLTSPFVTRLGDVNRTGTNQGGNIKFAASSSNDVASYQYQFVRFNLNGSHAATGLNVSIAPSVCVAGICHWNNVTLEENQMWIYRLRAIDHAGNKSSWTDWNDLTDSQFSNLKNQPVSYQDFMQKTGAFSAVNGYGDGTTGFTIREEVEPSSVITTPDPAGVFVTANAALTVGYSAQDAHTAVAKVELYIAPSKPNFRFDTETSFGLLSA